MTRPPDETSWIALIVVGMLVEYGAQLQMIREREPAAPSDECTTAATTSDAARAGEPAEEKYER